MDRQSARPGEKMNAAQKKKLVTDAKITSYNTKWEIVSEKITKDIKFVPDTLKSKR